MRPSNLAAYMALLIPAPWFASDFIPVWMMAGLSALLVWRVFLPPPSWFLVPACFGMSYFCFKEYGGSLVPETSVGFLACMVAAKICQKESPFNSALIVGLIWVGSFAIFNNTAYYLLYLILFFFGLVNLLNKDPGAPFGIARSKSSLVRPLFSMAKTLPLVIALFLFFPRFRGFIPSAAQGRQESATGYSKTVDNSSVSNLSLSSKTAFFAEIPRKVAPELLYWRGRTHSSTDGYNWRPQARRPEKSLPVAGESSSIEYTLKYQQDLLGDLVLLETPLRIEGSEVGRFGDQGANTYKSYVKNKKLNLSAVSSLDGHLRSPLSKTRQAYLKLPGFMPKAFKELSSQIAGGTPEEIIESFALYLKKNGFKYTLNPGSMPGLADFIKNKKGFCTHYASLLGVLLRHRGHPARLVSGFQGGEYNEEGGFYTVRSSDAHAWVEYHSDGMWKRSDPTGFVSPQRLRLGGQVFFESSNSASWTSSLASLAGLRRLEQFMSNINYKLAAFFDDYDRNAQKELAKKFNLELSDFYKAGALAALLAFGALIIAARKKRGRPLAPEDREFQKIAAMLKNKGLSVPAHKGALALAKDCRQAKLPENFALFMETYQKIKYQNKKELLPKLSGLRKSLKRLPFGN